MIGCGVGVELSQEGSVVAGDAEKGVAVGVGAVLPDNLALVQSARKACQTCHILLGLLCAVLSG